MAHSAHQTEDELIEHFDTQDVLETKAEQLANLIRRSKHTVVFTGAGISTSAGIGDYRGPKGLWTMKAQGKTAAASVPLTGAVGTFAHMALVELHRRGMLKYVISQNVDGVHRRSGIPHSAISELHGNDNKEVCSRCGCEYYRDFGVRIATGVNDHATGRYCEDRACKGMLNDTVVNFGENLLERELSRAIAHSGEADLHIILGSSCRVTPAADLPLITKRKGGHIVVCNLQTTPLDSKAKLVIRARTDDLMRLVMRNLGIDTVPSFALHRYVVLTQAPSQRTAGNITLELRDVDGEGEQHYFIQKLEVSNTTARSRAVCKRPFLIDCQPGDALSLNIAFEGNYNEPALHIPYTVSAGAAQVVYCGKFTPGSSDAWLVEPCALPQTHLDSENILSRVAALDNSRHDAEMADAAEVLEFDLHAPAPDLKGVAVQPRRCPHIEESDAVRQLSDDAVLQTACHDCADASESWLCTACHGVYCSRYVNKHMAMHANATKHFVAVSLSDLSVWCFKCDAYAVNRSLSKLVDTLHEKKFGQQ
eukprot:TRINITY_DN4207_c0_g4_i1.p1 TRINITY_DN4207_c0_g4~~TRINITY_DN4207_c0_g4_i1.p1  ORF type:complete len:536 (-),score=107.53 TRINITY_DN4207_c0_g4_i1:22-1629(-)